MRVLHLVPSFGLGGAEAVAQTLALEGAARGWSCPLDRLPEGRSPLRWALGTRAAVDVVHAHLPWPDRLGLALLAARGRALVVTFHLLPEEGRWPRDRVFRIPSPWCLAAAGRRRSTVRWVALSRHDQRVLEGSLGRSVAVVKNAPPAPPARVHPIPWEGEGLRVVTLGRLSWQKGLGRLVSALARPPVRSLPWQWCIVGEGEERGALEARVRAAGLAERVRFVGTRNAAEAFHGAELCLFPSVREGMPLVPLEAAEAGVPVLASDLAPHRELYEGAPQALLPTDESAWPEALARWFTDLAGRRDLARAQRALLGNDPRGRLFHDYEALYRTLTP